MSVSCLSLAIRLSSGPSQQELGALKVGPGVDVRENRSRVSEPGKFGIADERRRELRHSEFRRGLLPQRRFNRLEVARAVAPGEWLRLTSRTGDHGASYVVGQPGEVRGRQQGQVAGEHDHRKFTRAPNCRRNSGERMMRLVRFDQYFHAFDLDRSVPLGHDERIESGTSERSDGATGQGTAGKGNVGFVFADPESAAASQHSRSNAFTTSVRGCFGEVFCHRNSLSA